MNIKAAYIHIPFCKTICSYCDFCKMLYNEKWIGKYLDSLKNEILNNYGGEKLSTIYIGGGTPNALSDDAFEKLLQIIDKLIKEEEYEYTIECNVELLTEKQIILMKKYGVNRVSLGVQTFQEKFLKFLNRHHKKEEVIDKINLLKSYGIFNINIDLMYALPGETLKDLENDISCILELNVPHVSTYSLMIEPHTKLYCDNVIAIDDSLDSEMYRFICHTLYNYMHYEISNFCLTGYESKHNLTYWNNEEYYGFGLGASGYTENIRYTNTRNLTSYLNQKYQIEAHTLTKGETMENELILGLRKIKGVSMSRFLKKYGRKIEDVFDIQKLLEDKKLIKYEDYIKINEKYIYISNDILINFIGCDEDE